MAKEKAPWGTYAKAFWRFYRSGEPKQKKEFQEEREARDDMYTANKARKIANSDIGGPPKESGPIKN